MATYNGAIINGNILYSKREKINNGYKLFLGNAIGGTITRINNGAIAEQGEVIYGKITRVWTGLELRDFKFSKFERIPKERILNKFSLLGGNIKF